MFWDDVGGSLMKFVKIHVILTPLIIDCELHFMSCGVSFFANYNLVYVECADIGFKSTSCLLEVPSKILTVSTIVL